MTWWQRNGLLAAYIALVSTLAAVAAILQLAGVHL